MIVFFWARGVDGIHLRVGGQPNYNQEPNVDERQNRDFPRHSTSMALFSGSYPAILSVPKASLDSIQVGAFVDFGAMWTFEE